MGAWGAGVFADDLACDIRDGFRDLIGDGLTPEAATDRMKAEYASALADPDEASVFWLALAMTQWKLGRLLPEIRQQALAVIDDGRDLARWSDAKLRRKREAVLAQARTDLIAPQRRAVRVTKREKSSTPLSPGDVVVYTHDSGAVVALWVIANKTDKGGTYSKVQVAAVGRPDLPSLDVIEATDAPRFAIRGREGPLHMMLLGCQRLPEGRWTILGNLPWPHNRAASATSTAVSVNPSARSTRQQPMSLDRHLDVCFES